MNSIILHRHGIRTSSSFLHCHGVDSTSRQHGREDSESKKDVRELLKRFDRMMNYDRGYSSLHGSSDVAARRLPVDSWCYLPACTESSCRVLGSQPGALWRRRTVWARIHWWVPCCCRSPETPRKWQTGPTHHQSHCLRQEDPSTWLRIAGVTGSRNVGVMETRWMGTSSLKVAWRRIDGWEVHLNSSKATP